jgi:hypothetical protein
LAAHFGIACDHDTHTQSKGKGAPCRNS